MQIKFVATKKMPAWNGHAGLWRDGRVEDIPDDIANRLLGLYESPFVKVGEKSISPPSDKMIHGAPETKKAEIDKLKEPDEDNKKSIFKPKAWSKKKAKKKR